MHDVTDQLAMGAGEPPLNGVVQCVKHTRVYPLASRKPALYDVCAAQSA